MDGLQSRASTHLVSSRMVVGIFLLSIGVILIALAFSPISFAIVGSSSMNPSLSTGDVVVWTAADIDDINPGDIVVYKSCTCWPEEKIIVHRAIEVLTDHNGETILATKGDADATDYEQTSMISEPYVERAQVLGKVVCIGKQPVTIPFIGMIGLLTK